ncbi:hypothetical protein PYW08_012827 [Mythimna loreyi]|uniref:Uncharacterized protein n=1 Tax=Mythimna loreyi TaxID=667449 RepID=A0ACC2Q1H3_9NEOP|nr:hypothetical protein PYW08_012827 [Mythimna loreyi]
MPSRTNASKTYQKRPGTFDIRGKLYETKLLSLIYFRAIHDKNVEEIYLASNVDKVGCFDDICLRAKLKGIDKPMTVFIQAKHRENSNSVLTINKSDLVKYFKSYLEIKSKFKPNNDDVLFDGKFDETECLFVIYTTAKGDKKPKKYEGNLADHLNTLIGTGEPGSQPPHDEQHVQLLCTIVVEEQMKALARLMAKCIFGELNDNQMFMLMKNELLIQYHVILAQEVFDVSDIQPGGHRNASFRDDFFDINKNFLQLFKDELCTEILKRKHRDNPIHSSHLLESPEIYNGVRSRFIYKNGKFVLRDQNAIYYYGIPFEMDDFQENIRRADELEIKEYFKQLSRAQSTAGHAVNLKSDFSTLLFKVPASFGNKDMTIKGTDMKVERKINNLTANITKLIEQANPSNIITIDHSLGKGFLQLSGGIASAVGNLLVSDESSNLLKFNENYNSLGNLAKKLYYKLKEKYDLAKYKFDVKTKLFPKLSIAIDEYTRKVVSDFLNTLVFYTSQCDERNVEETLKNEININQNDEVRHEQISSDAKFIYLMFHDEIQKWSMEGKGIYLEKEGTLYKNAVKLYIERPAKCGWGLLGAGLRTASNG